MRRFNVRKSPVHGNGMFAVRPLAAGERVIEHQSEITTWKTALRRHRGEGVAGHTFLLGLSDGRVIDGSRGGNSARWLNHAGVPNCETIDDGEPIFIYTLRPVDAGAELLIDYLLEIDDAVDEEGRAQYAFARASAGCR